MQLVLPASLDARGLWRTALLSPNSARAAGLICTCVFDGVRRRCARDGLLEDLGPVGSDGDHKVEVS